MAGNRRKPHHKAPDGSRFFDPPKPEMVRERHRPGAEKGNSSAFWLYGLHAAKAALANPRRKIRRAVLAERAAAELGKLPSGLNTENANLETVARLLPPGAVHQGVALLCEPLAPLSLEAALGSAGQHRRIVAVLDQVTDPHNEGAILRSASAFGVAAVIVQDRHAPPESGALAKAASGALDIVPRIVTVNIARALEALGRLGFWRVALAADGDAPLAEAAPPGDVAVVFGAEGTGLRRLVRERCDQSAFIPLTQAMESLNVSNAAAIAFYEFSRPAKPPEI